MRIILDVVLLVAGYTFSINFCPTMKPDRRSSTRSKAPEL